MTRIFLNDENNLSCTIYGIIWLITQNKPAAMSAVAGMVSTQAMAISWATPQRTLFARSPVPTPMIAELTTCVVLTGPPSRELTRMTIAEVI